MFSKIFHLQTWTNKVKLKSTSQNQRKKSKKSNLNNTFKQWELIDSIMKISMPEKKSHSKMNQTITFYANNNQPQVKFSNRDYMNQSKNSRSVNKKKGLAYMKQMMNKTVMIQNNDYHILENQLPDSKCSIILIVNADRIKINKKQMYAIQNELIVRFGVFTCLEKQIQRNQQTFGHQRVY